MGFSTRSKSTSTRLGNLRGSLDKLSIVEYHPTTKKSQATKIKTKAARFPVALPRPPLSFQQDESMATNILTRITQVEHVGGSIDTDLLGFFNFCPTLTRSVEGHLRSRKNNPKTKLWIYLVSEGLEKDDGHTKIIEQLPIIVVVESEVAPANYTCRLSLQSD